MKKCLDDYIESYNQYKSIEPLKAMVIHFKYIDNHTDFILSDAPESYLLGSVNKIRTGTSKDFVLGNYKGILCKIYDKGEKINIFSKLDSTTINKADEFNHVKDSEGNIIELDMTLINWEPILVITYKISNGIKEIQYIKEGTTMIKDFK